MGQILYFFKKSVEKMGRMCYYNEKGVMKMPNSIKYDSELILNKLIEVIEESGLSYGEIARRTGIPKSSIHRYASGKTKKIPIDAVRLISEATGVSTSYIMGREDKQENSYSLPQPTITENTTTFPVIGDIAAGYDFPAYEDWTGDTIEIPDTYLRGHDKSEFFVLRVKGNSMFPMYHDGDKVLILKQSTLNYSGEIGAILYNDDCGTLKKVEYKEGEDWLNLIPINPNYEPVRIEGEALEHCRVLGVPRLLIRELD